jgi:hypothetical protein
MKMAGKKAQIHNKKDSITVKWVKRAQMWCKTIIKDNSQKQEWFSRDAKPSTQDKNQKDA